MGVARIYFWVGGTLLENLQKKFLRKLRKSHYFFQKNTKQCINISTVWMKNTICWKFWENFRNFEKGFLRKLLKMHDFSIFFKRFNELCVNFSHVWTKNANCREILRKFWKFPMKIQYKIWIFILFLILFFENLLLNIEPSGNNTTFLQQFFRFRGSGKFPLPPGYAPVGSKEWEHRNVPLIEIISK